MSQPQELVGALLGEYCRSDQEADAVLVAAQLLGVDPLSYCAHRFALSAETVTERAAHWAGFAFSPTVPARGIHHVGVRQLDQLSQVHSLREKLLNREVIFLAPGFDELIRLKDYARTHPEVRHSTCLAPASAIRTALTAINSEQLLDEARQRLARRWPFASADLDLGALARTVFILAAMALAAMATLAPLLLQTVLLPLVAIILLAPAIFRLAAVAGSPGFSPPVPAPPAGDRELPIYSVLIPLNDEAQMVPLLHRAMTALDYPPEKLDIKFVVEADSAETIAAVRPLLADPRFELVVVPDAAPRTKPKALNYALPLVRGAHVVVYDAEDIPNPDQLRLAAAEFAADPGVDCLQAELLVDNARENLLTALFTGEYAGQFGIMLPALSHWNFPMPLGGTSNHFRTRELRQMGGWDAFNVTEDADLGLRLARLRYRTAVLPSQTYEEAPVTLGVWMRQRTRWMKGWMQTFIVHNHNPVRLWRDLGWKGFLAFEIYVGSMILSPLMHTFFVIGLLVGLLTGSATGMSLAGPRMAIEVFVLVIGYGGSAALVIAGLLRLGQWRLLPHQLALPLYWVLHTVAVVVAGYELLTRPSFWAKTAHGRTRLERSFLVPPALRNDLSPGLTAPRRGGRRSGTPAP